MIFFVLCSLVGVGAKELACGFPGSPAYGFVKPALEAFEEGAVVYYYCPVGYILVGSPISRCTEDGSWTEEVPICDDSMTTLGVVFSTPALPGHAAEMAIDRDKETCAYLKPRKARWLRIDLGNVHNSEKVPKVLSVAVTLDQTDKNVKFSIFVIKTHNGSASYKRCASFSGKFGAQTVVMSCAEGKGIYGEKVNIEDHLQTEGLFGICEVEVQVEKETGYDCGEPSRNLHSVTYARRDNKVDYGCVSGYEINGIDYRTCNDSGHWSGNPPVCEPILCDELEPFENGNIRLSHEDGPPLEGAIAIYKCDEGYKLMGSFTRHCLRDGSWSGKPPHCEGTQGDISEGPPSESCHELLYSSNVFSIQGFPNAEQIKSFCPSLTMYLNCIEDYKSMYDFEEFGIFSTEEEFAKVQDFVKDICDINSTLYKAYVQNLECMVSLNLSECVNEAFHVYRNYLNFKKNSIPERDEPFEANNVLCVTKSYSLMCAAMKTFTHCGSQAHDISKELINRSNLFKIFCKRMELHDIRTMFMDFLGVDDEQRDIMTSVLNP